MTDSDTPLRSLHTTYLRLTGRTDRYEPYRYEWANWARVYTEQDLISTLGYVLLVNKSRKRGMEIQTSVRRLICDLQEFERHRADAELAEKARAAKARAWKPTPSEAAWAEAHGEQPIPPETPAKRLSLDTVVEALRSAKQ